MLTLGSLALVNPWILLALAALPALWWLLKVTPPAPRRIPFPAIRLLLGLATTEQTPARTPLWLLVLRLLLAALVIVALAHPLLNPNARLAGTGPLVIVVDNGWAAASRWQRRSETMADLLAQAERAGRPVAVLATAPPVDGGPIRASGLLTAAEARERVQSLRPLPWPTDRAAAGAALADLALEESAEVVWLSDGLDGGLAELAAKLRRLGPTQVLIEPADALPMALTPPSGEGSRLTVRALRAARGFDISHWVRASDAAGRLMTRAEVHFEAASGEATADLDVPVEVRNKVARLEIENQRSVGAVVLLDERWRRRPVGLVSGGGIEAAQPLLANLFYLERALNPFADVRTGTIEELLQRDLAVLVLADVGQVIGSQRDLLDDWLERGGVLVRFAGPKLAKRVDDLIPVRLRGGGRSLGGALSWSRPARLAPFDAASPFAGLAVSDDVRVRRQVLAEPSLDLGAKTWARLSDGTPLVTADRRGNGRLVLFHVTANAEWSNLPLSGLFVELLRRIVGISQGVGAGDAAANLSPLATLDGFGVIGAPPASARPLATSEIANIRVSPTHPPGYYGTTEARRAVNLSAGLSALSAAGSLPQGVQRSGYTQAPETDLKPWLLAAAILLGLIDLVASYWLRGLFALGLSRARAASAAAMAAALLAAAPAAAQSPTDQFALTATFETHLAYVQTGLEELDAMSRAGLLGLGEALAQRTSVEPGRPIGVDLERDELAFFPLLYWPIAPEQPDVSDYALEKIDAYMKNGGTILFDTRDQGAIAPGLGFGGASSSGPGMQRLRQILGGLNIPPLVPVPDNHVLTKAFYLLQEFPGRWTGGQVWVERHGGGVNDGVSSIIIGGNDWAASWAIDDEGRPIAAVVPGGEPQREMAYRFGVNVVMYALTGNYKADQVHVPAILERLGQ